MAICEHCDQEMETADGCIGQPRLIGGTLYAPIRSGEEPGGWAARWRCGDCCAQPGAAHHAGCDMEVCPACGGQAIGCACVWPGKLEFDEDDFAEFGEFEAVRRIA